MAVILGEKSYLTVMENLKWAIYVQLLWGDKHLLR